MTTLLSLVSKIEILLFGVCQEYGLFQYLIKPLDHSVRFNKFQVSFNSDKKNGRQTDTRNLLLLMSKSMKKLIISSYFLAAIAALYLSLSMTDCEDI